MKTLKNIKALLAQAIAQVHIAQALSVQAGALDVQAEKVWSNSKSSVSL